MLSFKKLLAGKVLLILLFAGALSYVDSVTDLKLGLDLKGGTQLDYAIDLSKVDSADRDQIVEGVKEVIRRRVDGLGVSEPSIYVSNIAEQYHVIVELAGITDLEDAKATVGKTIQLEFREENTNPEEDAEQAAWASEAANAFLDKVNAGEDFIILAQAEQKEYADEVYYEEGELTEVSLLDTATQDAVKDQEVGFIFGPYEADSGYVLDASGVATPNKGMTVIQMIDREVEEETTTTEEKVSARHILIAYEGAERADEGITRTEEEALARAEEVQGRLEAGENFETLAGEYTDDASGKENGGDLGEFGRGQMTQAFEDAAFALEVEGVSEIVETEFGYHIMTVYAKQEASEEVTEIEKVSLNKIIYSTAPSPWIETPAMTGEHFKHADVTFNQNYQPYVSITFTEEGATLFEALTEKNVGKKVAIFVGGSLISAPNVQEKISGGQAQITGDFTIEEAQNLARDLNTGAIPAPVDLVGQYNISATLGQEALDQSLFAGLIGVIILAIFMILYYRLPGLISTVALAIYSLLLIFMIKTALPTAVALLISLALFGIIVHLLLKNRDSGGEKFIAFLVACFVLFFMTMVLSTKITLTLAGIAGVILSIGMAVDANVLIFERMKEELGHGKGLTQAIDEGFRRAWDSIRDSNFSSLITCAILFYFGSSIIRGFALNLALGILLSMFSAIMLTRTLLHFISETKLSEKLALWGKPRVARAKMFPIIQQSKLWMSVSGVLLAIALIFMFTFPINWGLDFTGGSMLEIKTGTEATAETITDQILEVEAAVTGDFGTPQVVSTDQGTFLIRLKHITDEQHAAIIAKLGTVEEIRFTTVGPTIGETLKQKAGWALVFASIMIVLYIAFAFRKVPKEVSAWKFGATAIVALLHDILIVIGVFVVLGHYMDVEIDALFITALLTVMGFSVHDTIVVFDRIRENLRFREDNETLATTANKALNQTMARSINTSLCTLLTILALFIFGAESIRWFVFALIVGITAGTYSSIFIASPLLVWWTTREARK
ncbi:protein-export membrane protein SecF [Candidatus Peregrinibacteria bacterium RIFCSPLOWO2_02_FULL_48_14]|nr:MAG: protein-export membrane protein SecF [Candidatus Peregrinibacteria bacterium RIFCSPLOWO2_01_FULL_48_20]OGJ45501.1 MAG: protein-export membrane protein SecF [Candidatus Peregrinibacteria bacterium RIFCSPLOWO2_02_FULL_48_14]